MPADIRLVRETDRSEWLRMRRLLWPECPEAEHAAEMDGYLRAPGGAVLVAERQGGGLGGFVETALRLTAEGCGAGPVGYVEGWFVDADLRRRGLGRELVRAAEQWARSKGCHEMASDAEIDNRVSRSAHAALGYQEVNGLAHFRKSLGPASRQPASRTFDLLVLPGKYAVCRLPAEEPLPAWATAGVFVSVTRTREELSVVCPEDAVPGGVECRRGWRCLRVAGRLDFSLVGVLASLLAPVAEAGVSVVALSTFDTDYFLVPEADLAAAAEALRGRGHRVGPAT
jgi:GNAT superfamily N-acetyltransferase